MSQGKKGRGKRFEAEVHKTLKHHPAVAWIYRARDTAPSPGMRFAHTNPIDLMGCLEGGQAFFVECKAISSPTLSFRRFLPRNKNRKSGSLTSFRQWGALYRCWRAGACVYVALNTHGQEGRDGIRGQAYLVPFGLLVKLRHLYHLHPYRSRRKSWPVSELTGHSQTLPLEKVTGRWVLTTAF
jgi:hypothetical protein